MNKTDLKSLSNKELLLRLSKLVNQSRRVESVLVAHLAEVDARRLYASEASPSMFQYCRDVAPARYIVRFTASGELRDKLERLTALTPGSDLASIIDAAVSEKLERLEARRFGKTNKPRKNLNDADTSAGVRGISAPVRRFVWQRDRGQCTFVASNGRRCPERYRLEFHHDEAYGLGGDRSAGNIRLLCTAHNLYMAEKVYGKKKMEQYGRSADIVREPAPSFELRPDGAQHPSTFVGILQGQTPFLTPLRYLEWEQDRSRSPSRPGSRDLQNHVTVLSKCEVRT